MRSEKGVEHVSMLVRNKPFREWVTVYFDPTETSEKKLQKTLRARQCANATLVRKEEKPLTVMNPVVGPGGTVQLRISTPSFARVARFELPTGWKMAGATAHLVGKGDTYFSLYVPTNAKPGPQTIRLHIEDGDPLQATAEVARLVGG